jgi:hypothetical protein
VPKQGMLKLRYKTSCFLNRYHSSELALLQPTSAPEKVIHKFVDTTTRWLLTRRASPSTFVFNRPNFTKRERGGDDWKETSATTSDSGHYY